ncbi:Enhancer of mRNA-decapping protein 3 [Erysiphe neolycopersici]|uniref:Enhancer of mRNA-decapping protein 3 n=1 Tax=Erysiphe neolycopersici TaxID=212602 RepID=A0A420HWJ9_9PEZI|nr:Enhancer of mRNA-decapping protein 3 [Erysiphe neolycopersici]
MANNFIGLCMLVTLTSPPGAQVEGTVSGIEPGKSLTLSNVICPSTGKFTQELTLKAIDIQELKEVTSEETSSERITSQKSTNTMESKTFTDPAILSVGKRPIPNERSPMNTLESNSSWEQVTKPDNNNNNNNKISVASLVNHTKNISLADVMNEDLVHVKQDSPDTNYLSQSSRVDLKPKKRYQKRKLRRAEGDEDKDKEIVTNLTNPISKSKGWRQTPLLEPNPSFQPFSNLKRNGKAKREEEGWGTEDATDVQELGDFDFEGGLAKFDKNTIFNQFEAEDGIAAKDRLVSFNRVRSSNFGKNLPSSMNIIDESKPIKSFSKTKSDNWIESPKDANETQKTSHKEADISRHARHVESKINNNRRPIDLRSSRKDSANCSLSSSRNYSVSRVASNPGFYTLLCGYRCDPVSPLQMLNLENIATNELGLSEEVLTENAGRSIAEIAFSAFSNSRNLITRSNSTLNSTVVALVGNNKNGLRAVATARHIKNHGYNIILCVVGLEQESELLASLKSQIKIFRNIGGKVISKVELFEFSKQLDAPIDLIIDGLIGLAISFEELRLGEQSTIYELIEWANDSKAEVLAIDVPTGIDPTNGEVSIIDGRPLYLYPNYVVALGAPKKGLLEAMSLGYGTAEEEEDSRDHTGKRNSTKEWQLFVADIGLGEAVWKKAGSKIRRGIEFDKNWVIKILFKGLDE